MLMVAYLRDFNLRFLYTGNLSGMAPIQTGSGGDGSHLINALKYEQSRGHYGRNRKLHIYTYCVIVLCVVGCVGLHDHWYTTIANIYGQPQRSTQD